MKRLYEVTCTFTYYAYTENGVAAIRCAEEAARDTALFDNATVRELNYSNQCLAYGWDGNCLIYGTDDDMKLREALATLPEGRVK